VLGFVTLFLASLGWTLRKTLGEDSRNPSQYLNPELPQCVKAGMHKSPGKGSPGRIQFVQQGLLLLVGSSIRPSSAKKFELAHKIFGKFVYHCLSVEYIAKSLLRNCPSVENE
jgi:hypothetical protein